MKTVNDYQEKSDIEKIEAAIKDCCGGTVIIPPRKCKSEPERDYWLIDRAILIPENTTVILKNCKIKLSDKCRDNFFRTANCGMGIEYPEKISNVHIIGEGFCVLEGADHPRATGDGSKKLVCPCPKNKADALRLSEKAPDRYSYYFLDKHSHSYGTDAGNPNESHYGDWRGIGILFANAENCSVRNLHIRNPHGWSISFEACSNGLIENIDFDADMSRFIDGMVQNSENQDGIDIRNGCHDIIIQNITGGTGDDVIALTAIAGKNYLPGGSLQTTHVMHNDWTKREKDIHDIIIRNVIARCKSGECNILRMLPAEAKIYNIIVDGIIDNSPEGFRNHAAVLLGEPDGSYGRNLPDDLYGIAASNIISKSVFCIVVAGYISDSSFTNIVNLNPECPVFAVDRENGFRNIELSSVVTKGKETVKYK